MANSYFDKDYFESARGLRNVRWGRPLRVHEEASSTNDLAMEAALAGMMTGGVFAARSQTRGRGRRGSTWTSEPGKNLTFSIVLRLPLRPEKISGLSLVAGLALAEASEAALHGAGTGHKVLVKWPNDVYVGEEKLAGILVELRAQKAETVAVTGIGWNISQTSFPPEAGTPTSLSLLGLGESVHHKEDLLLSFLGHFEKKISSWLRGGVAAVHPQLQERDALSSRAISVDGRPGIARGISEGGELLVDFGSGERRPILSGHIELIRG